ncbi:MAG: hypothetical protein IJ193_01995 [Bacilli bacterium]|nr:hypothetical protein [Bacilli bacterium]
MSKYYLIARDLKQDDLRILPLMSKWYRQSGDSVFTKENPLEAIDLVTMRFNDSKSLAKRLYSNQYIPNEDYEFFIVQRYRNNQQDKIRIHEVLYNTKEERTDYFREIAGESLITDLKGSKKNLRLYDRFLNKLYYNSEYYRVIQEGFHNIPKKVVDLYKDCNQRNTPPYFLKYHNTWIMESYPISRSIVESFANFDRYGNLKANVTHYQQLLESRQGLEEKLLQITSPEYLNGQLTLDLSVPKEEKLAYTLKTLTNLESGVITNHENQYSLNLDFDVEKKDAKKMQISKRVLKNAYWYLFHKMKLKELQYSYGNMSVLQEDMDADYRDLVKSLSKESVLNGAYDFCLLYNDYKNKQKVDGAYQKGRGTK